MKRRTLVTTVSLFLTASGSSFAQEPNLHPGALSVALSRLGSTARVLYIAAHPDDENTRLLAYFANQRHVDVAYLSLTRGGGGQNLIGTEQAELLAVVRTQELLAARRIDGARQFFTRARDFGYSKTPEEALAKWDEQAVLSDVVRVIRSFRPDLVITRFTEAGPSHGHHTASARLAHAAFKAAADPSQFPEQLTGGLGPWRAHRLMLNVPRWGRSDDDVAGYLAVDLGGYDPRLGASYPEIAARSRTMHKSQGFGSAGQRGPLMDYFQTLEGPAPKKDLLEGIPPDWSRFDGGGAVQSALKDSLKDLRLEAPERALKNLLKAEQALAQLSMKHPVPRVREPLEALRSLAGALLGLHIRAEAPRPEVGPGDEVEVQLSLLLRRKAKVQVVQVDWPGLAQPTELKLETHTPAVITHTLKVPSQARPSIPHWLKGRLSANVYPVTDPAQVFMPEDPAPLNAVLTLEVEGRRWRLPVPITHTWTDPVHGERQRPVQILPPLTVTPSQDVTLLPGGQARHVTLIARAAQAEVQGEVGLEVPPGWTVAPKLRHVALKAPGEEVQLSFEVKAPSAQAAPALARPYAEVHGVRTYLRYSLIDHPHIPVQAVLRDSSLRLAPLDFVVPKVRIAYVPGPGDTVAEYLAAAGLSVDKVRAEELNPERLRGFDVVLVGVRAYNTQQELLAAAHPALMSWVKAGGRLVVQYNTSNRWGRLEGPIGPYAFEIDRGRVTDENAEMKVLAKGHALLVHPHKIGPADFEGWVQERGLYFASTWAPEYLPIFEAHDPGEAPLQGSLLFAKHGKGSFIYTGLSFFRQLPAGVPGAYRLLANLLTPEVRR